MATFRYRITVQTQRKQPVVNKPFVGFKKILPYGIEVELKFSSEPTCINVSPGVDHPAIDFDIHESILSHELGHRFAGRRLRLLAI